MIEIRFTSFVEEVFSNKVRNTMVGLVLDKFEKIGFTYPMIGWDSIISIDYDTINNKFIANQIFIRKVELDDQINDYSGVGVVLGDMLDFVI